jgi:hypothetical protein
MVQWVIMRTSFLGANTERKYMLTDRVVYFCKTFGAFWLIDLILSHQRGKVAKEHFQVWTLQSTPAGDYPNAVTIIATDGNGQMLKQHYIGFSDLNFSQTDGDI